MSEFSFNTTEQFDRHINCSVPSLSTLYDSIVSLSSFIIKDKSTVLDLGCSTGLFLNRLYNKNPLPRYVGYDISTQLLAQVEIDDDIALILQDISLQSFEIQNFNFASLIFTLQFLSYEDRLPLLKKLNAAMKPRGCVIVAEKILMPTPFLEAITSMSHYDFKSLEFSANEILLKERALRKIMLPLTSYENIRLFNLAGFTATPFWQTLNFKAWILMQA